jgi:hypothetical protein
MKAKNCIASALSLNILLLYVETLGYFPSPDSGVQSCRRHVLKVTKITVFSAAITIQQ